MRQMPDAYGLIWYEHTSDYFNLFALLGWYMWWNIKDCFDAFSYSEYFVSVVFGDEFLILCICFYNK